MSSNFQLKRLPETKHPSLTAWNAADELMVTHLPNEADCVAIYNDAFGYLSCHLSPYQPTVITDLKSQEKAIETNLTRNNLHAESVTFGNLLKTLDKRQDIVYLKIPKSISLFELYLQHIHANLKEGGTVVCGFMTKYFTTGILDIANKYFDTVEQSKAKKKARLLFLKNKKEITATEKIDQFNYHGMKIQQYKGVFSAGKIDKATQFLLSEIEPPQNHSIVLDMACGNGIIGRWIMEKYTVDTMHFMDDSYLAMASTELNIAAKNTCFHHDFQLSDIEDYSLDWVVTNPPFHFGNTIDTSIPIGLFKAAHQKLKSGGILTIVANSNLGYEGFLKSYFKAVKIRSSNRQFKIFECTR